MVPGDWRDAPITPCAVIATPVRAVPIDRGARGTGDPAHARARRARDRPSLDTRAVDDLARGATECRDAWPWVRLSGHDGAVARRPSRSSSEGRPDWRSMRRSARMWKTVWPVWSSRLTAPPSPVPSWRGRGVGTGPGSTGGGRRRGVRNKLPSPATRLPTDPSMHISHEAIYQALYVQGRGALAP